MLGYKVSRNAVEEQLLANSARVREEYRLKAAAPAKKAEVTDPWRALLLELAGEIPSYDEAIYMHQITRA